MERVKGAVLNQDHVGMVLRNLVAEHAYMPEATFTSAPKAVATYYSANALSGAAG